MIHIIAASLAGRIFDEEVKNKVALYPIYNIEDPSYYIYTLCNNI